jgi:hypothetical protein
VTSEKKVHKLSKESNELKISEAPLIFKEKNYDPAQSRQFQPALVPQNSSHMYLVLYIFVSSLMSLTQRLKISALVVK